MSQSDDAARINGASSRASLSLRAWDGVLFWSLCQHEAFLGCTYEIQCQLAL